MKIENVKCKIREKGDGRRETEKREDFSPQRALKLKIENVKCKIEEKLRNWEIEKM